MDEATDPRQPRTAVGVTAALLYAAILAVGLVPGDALSLVTAPIAVVGHGLAYAALAVLVRAALADAPGAGMWALLVVTAAALGNEATQLLVPGRAADPFDVGVDLLGALGGLLARRAMGQAFVGWGSGAYEW